ncbi:hypothetical protein SAMN04489801_4526 [Pseudomonas mandelii]|uniref:Uncharacterized protein n=1 Tax=Pseudomonas mandelii TaxID=75612 RepID=A0ABY0VUV2_9PSED|nr:hypothetical protein SAMN04489801_4526 [Pseudomonas mandelii]
MPHADLSPPLLFRINENQLALEAAILELKNQVEQRGALSWSTTCAVPWRRPTAMRNSSR